MADNNTQIQWFPGHMTKTLRQMEKGIYSVDIIVEILDSRIPFSSQNPVLRRIGKHKNRIYILTKEDLSDETITRQWINYFSDINADAISINTKTNKTKEKLEKFLEDYFDSGKARIKFGKPRMMFVGVPNVGKSSVINILLGKNIARVEDRPGVTRGKQWYTTDDYELLDMPGVLWPKFDSDTVGYNLAFTGAIRDEVFDTEAVASSLLLEISEIYPENLLERSGITAKQDMTGYDLLVEYAKNRNFLVKGGEYDTERAAKAVLYDLRNGKFGRITLEEP
ncbi:MAG: ribosome biogenesis GTPase YlqF [Methanobrevibacter sp.]|nr:ribosome biogenesis GTPase YlqF [Methanobrevibacter sp.]